MGKLQWFSANTLILPAIIGLIGCISGKATPPKIAASGGNESLTLAGGTEPFIVFPSNLVLDGIPPIPTSFAEPIVRYTQFTPKHFASWAPLASSDEMLVLAQVGNTQQVHNLRAPKRALEPLTILPDRVSSAQFPPNTAAYFIFSRDVGGNEWNQTYRYDFATKETTLLTDGKSKNSLGVFSPSGKWLAYASTRRNGRDYDFYVADPLKGQSERLITKLEHGEAWNILDWSLDERQLLATEATSITDSSVWLVDVANGAKLQLAPKPGAPHAAYLSPRFLSATPAINGKFFDHSNQVIALSNASSEFMQLVAIDIASGKERTLASKANADIEAFDISHDKRTIAFVANEGFDRVYLFDLKSGAIRPVPAIPNGVISSLRWHPHKRTFAFSLASSNVAGAVFTFDVDKHEFVQWTDDGLGSFNKADFAEAQFVHWPTFDGRTIEGVMVAQPKFTGKRPVVISIHGGPESQARPGFLDTKNYFVNELGITYIFPNVRGSSGYGKTFLSLDDGYLRTNSYKDIGALLDWIRNDPRFNSDEIMIEGGSYGGHMTLATSVDYSDRIACSIDIVGMSNLVTFLEHTEPYRRDLRRVEYGDERNPQMRAFLELIAPLNHASKIKKPLFVIQGKNDPRVPLSEAAQIVSAVRAGAVPVWYLVANDEGHGFRKRSNRAFQLYLTSQFIRKYLLQN